MQNTKTCAACESIARRERGGDGEPPVWARRYILIGIAVWCFWESVRSAYRLLSHDAPEVEVARASAQSSEVGWRRALRQRLHRRPPQDQPELQSDRPREMDRRRKGRQGQGRPGPGAPGRSTSSAPSTIRPEARLRTPGLIWRNCRTDRVPRKFSRPSTISMKPGPPLANDRITLDRTREPGDPGRALQAGARRCHCQV